MLIRLLHLGTKTSSFALWLWLTISLPAQAEQLRVAISQKISQVQLSSSTPAIIEDSNGQKIGELQPHTKLNYLDDR
jgi:hypothetical protein